MSRVIKVSKRQHCCRLIAKSDKTKTMWNIIKHETGKLHLTEQIPSLLINDENIKDPKVITLAFNNFSLTITQNLNVHQKVKCDDISFLKEAFSRKFPGIKNIPIIETEKKV
jgi:hypothetical protein